MNTRQVVEYVRQRASGFTAQMVLDLLDHVHKVVLSRGLAQNYVLDGTTGLPPYLATTDGTYTYDCPTDCLRTEAICTESAVGYSKYNYGGKQRYYMFNGSQYYALPIRQVDATAGSLANVTFVDYNPGDTTTTYLHLYTPKPTDLTSVNVEMQVPERYALDMAHGVIALIRAQKYGADMEYEAWMQRTLPRICDGLNRGAQISTNQVPMQSENKEYGRRVY